MSQMEAGEAMDRFKRMKRHAEDVVFKVETFQQMIAKFVEEAAETLNSSRAKGEEYLAGVQKISESNEAQNNPLLKTLVQLMREDLQWFRDQETRLAEIRRHYSEIDKLYGLSEDRVAPTAEPAQS